METKINQEEENAKDRFKTCLVILGKKWKLTISRWFGNWLVMKKEFWMWLTNVIVAIIAATAAFMVAFD